MTSDQDNDLSTLPAVTDGGSGVWQAIVEYSAPFPVAQNITSAANVLFVKRKLERARDILINAIKAKGVDQIDQLSQGQKEFIFPAGMRYLDRVRLAEYEHNLKLLAEIFAESMREPTPDPVRFGSFVECLAGLTETELVIFKKCFAALDKSAPDNLYVSATSIERLGLNDFGANRLDIESGLARLSAKALLYSRGPATLDDVSACYLITKLGKELRSMAGDILEKKPDPV